MEFVNSAGVLGCENKCSTGVVKCKNIHTRTYILETLVTQSSGGNSTGVLGCANIRATSVIGCEKLHARIHIRHALVIKCTGGASTGGLGYENKRSTCVVGCVDFLSRTYIRDTRLSEGIGGKNKGVLGCENLHTRMCIRELRERRCSLRACVTLQVCSSVKIYIREYIFERHCSVSALVATVQVY